MPKKEHLPSVSDKEQRMYEHIEKSEREAGVRLSAPRRSLPQRS